MKKTLIFAAALAASSLVMAQEVGRVISATPIVEQVSVPRNVCTTEQVAAPQSKSGGGAIMGAIAGGAMGNAIGDGSGRIIATMIGLIGGAMVGDRIEGGTASQSQNVQRCSTQNFYENRPVAYNVVYEFAGKQYSVQMPHDPGPTINLNVTPVGASTPRSAPVSNTVIEQPVYSQPSSSLSAPPANTRYGAHLYEQPYPVYPVAAAEPEETDWRRIHRHWR